MGQKILILDSAAKANCVRRWHRRPVALASVWAFSAIGMVPTLHACADSETNAEPLPPVETGLAFDQAFNMSPDSDDDGLKNLIDNCPYDANPDQLDSNDDGYGDVCGDFLEVEIDIMPHEMPNVLSLSSNGIVPAALISGNAFDATAVLPESVSISGTDVKLTGKGKNYLCDEQDVNGDGLADLICRIHTAKFLLIEGESTVLLEAFTQSGDRVRGEDSIVVVSQ